MQIIEQVTDYFLKQTPNLTGFGIVGIILTLAIAVLMLLFGYKLMRVVITVTGIFIGFLIGSLIAIAVGASSLVAIVLIIVCAAAVGLLAGILYKVGLFLTGFFLAFTFVHSLIASAVGVPLNYIIAAVVGIIVGVIVVILMRPAFIIITGMSGGIMIVYVIVNEFAKWSGTTAQIVTLSAGAVLGILGIIYQFRHTAPANKGRRR